MKDVVSVVVFSVFTFPVWGSRAETLQSRELTKLGQGNFVALRKNKSKFFFRKQDIPLRKNTVRSMFVHERHSNNLIGQTLITLSLPHVVLHTMCTCVPRSKFRKSVLSFYVVKFCLSTFRITSTFVYVMAEDKNVNLICVAWFYFQQSAAWPQYYGQAKISGNTQSAFLALQYLYNLL